MKFDHVHNVMIIKRGSKKKSIKSTRHPILNYFQSCFQLFLGANNYTQKSQGSIIMAASTATYYFCWRASCHLNNQVDWGEIFITKADQ